MSSVDFVLKRGNVFWGKYCDTGHLVVERQGERSFLGRMEDFPGIDPCHCLLIEGWLEGMGTALGAVDMHAAQERCVHRGDAHCAFSGSWAGLRGLLS